MLESIIQAAAEAFPGLELTITMDSRNIVTVCGEAQSWNQVVDVGHFLAKQKGVKNVVNEMTVKGLVIPRKDYSKDREQGLAIGEIGCTDVLIIGAGITG